MAEETDDAQKTEDPTSKRLDEARGRGQVANSREVNHLLMLGVFSLAVLFFGASAGGAVMNATMPFIESPDLIPADFGNLVIASVSFLDEAIGQLALRYKRKELVSKLKLRRISSRDKRLLNDIFISRYRQMLQKKKA